MIEAPSLFRDPESFRAACDAARSRGLKVGFVPTMGALHEGHLALAAKARERASFTAVSIFVNPTQFGPNEDFSRYPRDEIRDVELLAGAKVDAIFLPTSHALYVDGERTRVRVAELTDHLCGPFRPGHFEGVATVEASNNAANGANLVPLMTLGIPGNASTALLLGAFIMYGLKPGPMLMETNPDFFWAVVASLYIGNVMLLILNLPLVNLFAKLLDVPEALLNGLVLALCFLGVYTREYLLTDLYLMIAFGIIGYFAERYRYPIAPLLLGLVLGNLLEQALLRSMSISNGDPSIFFTRPISLVIMIAALISLAYSFRKFYRGKRTSPDAEGDERPAPSVGADAGHPSKQWLTADRLTAMSTIPISIGLIYVALEAPRPNIPMAVGPHVWPICILVLLIACALPMLWRRANVMADAPGESPAGVTRIEPNWYARPGMAAVLTVAGLVMYALLLEVLGFLLCTILLVLYQTRVIQPGHWVRNVATAVIFSVLLYFGMTELLSVKLPAGMLTW